MQIAQGNLQKKLELTLTTNGVAYPVDELTDDIVLRWWTPDGDVVEVEPVIVDDAAGEIEHEFEAGQTDVVGYYRGQVTVSRDNGDGPKPRSFPEDGSFFMWEVTKTI